MRTFGNPRRRSGTIRVCGHGQPLGVIGDCWLLAFVLHITNIPARRQELSPDHAEIPARRPPTSTPVGATHRGRPSPDPSWLVHSFRATHSPTAGGHSGKAPTKGILDATPGRRRVRCCHHSGIPLKICRDIGRATDLLVKRVARCRWDGNGTTVIRRGFPTVPALLRELACPQIKRHGQRPD